MDKNSNLKKLVEELQRGNEQSFTDIYEITQQDLYVYALMLMKKPERAQDLMQDTYLKIYQSIDSLRDPSKFMPWAKRILYTQAMMHYRKLGKEPIPVDDEKGFIFDNIVEEGTEYIPEEKVDRQELQSIVFDVVKVLPAQQRVAMIAFYYDEMSVNEIAEMMGCSVGTVKSRLYYARSAFKDKIESYEEKHNIKLHSATPLLLVGFKDFDKAAAASHAATGKTLSAILAKGNIGGAGTIAGSAGSGAGAAVKVAAGASVKKVVAGVAIAALVAGGGGIGIYNGLNSNDSQKPETKIVKEQKELTPYESAMQAYKKFLEEKQGAIKGYRIAPLGEEIPTLLCGEEENLSNIRKVRIIQYSESTKQVESLGDIESGSSNGLVYYRNNRLYTAGYLNGVDFSEYEIQNGEVSVAGYYVNRDNRVVKVSYKGPLRGVGTASDYINEEVLNEPADDIIDRYRSEYESSKLTLEDNNEENRERIK